MITTKKTLWSILTAVLILLFAFKSANAKYSQLSKVKYSTRHGWSQWYTVNVAFLTGFELNQITGTLNYSTFQTYAVIFWEPNQATLIELEGFYTCGMETSESCVTMQFPTPHGKDQEGRDWKVCVSDFCY